MRKILPVLAILAITPATPQRAAAAEPMPDQEIQAVGRGTTKSENKAAAFARAEEDAIRQAVEKVAEQLLGHEAVVANYPDLKERILKKPRRYLKEYRISNRIDKGSTVIVKMTCVIQTSALMTDLEAVGLLGVPASGLPKIAILPDPKGAVGWWVKGGKANAPAPLTELLAASLKSRGFETVATTPPKKPLSKKAPVAAIRRLGGELGAQAVLAVRWEVESTYTSFDGLAYVSAMAKLTSVTALEVGGGKKLASVTAQGVAGKAVPPTKADETDKIRKDKAAVEKEALARAAEDAATKLAEKFGAARVQKAPAELRLVVAGLGSYPEFARFQQAFATKLSTVTELHLAGAERGEAQFVVKLNGTLKAFTDQVKASKFGFDVKVTESQNDRVVLHVSR